MPSGWSDTDDYRASKYATSATFYSRLRHRQRMLQPYSDLEPAPAEASLTVRLARMSLVALILIVFISYRAFAYNMDALEAPVSITRTSTPLHSRVKHWHPVHHAGALKLPDAADAGHASTDELASQVDAVWTYVDPTVKAWRRALAAELGINDTAIDAMNRYRDWGEIRYSMRSAFMNAPWLRRVYLVVASAEHVPAWLNITHPSIRVIYHHQLFDDPAHMPTFNSLAIESVLHRIPDLSEQFIYFNNDVFLGAPTPLSRFATRTVYRRCVDWPLIGAGLRGKAARRANPCLAAIDVATAQHFWASNRPTQPHTPPPPATLRQCAAPPAGAEHPLDRWVAQIVFNQPLHHWFCHKPHLMHRPSIVEIEHRLSDRFARSRLAHVRDPGVDLSMFMLFEAFVRERVAARSRAAGGSRRRLYRTNFTDSPMPWLEVETNGIPQRQAQSRDEPQAYIFVTFKERDAHARFYHVLDCHLIRGGTHFFGIDDDLGSAPDPSAIEFHRAYLGALMRRHWSRMAPWELRDDDAGTNDEGIVRRFACPRADANLGLF